MYRRPVRGLDHLKGEAAAVLGDIDADRVAEVETDEPLVVEAVLGEKDASAQNRGRLRKCGIRSGLDGVEAGNQGCSRDGLEREMDTRKDEPAPG